MRSARRRLWAIAVVAAPAISLLILSASPEEAPVDDQFSVELAFQHSEVLPDGRTLTDTMPPMRIRVERVSRQGRSKQMTTLLSGQAVSLGLRPGSASLSSVEVDDGGEVVSVMSDGSRRLLPGLGELIQLTGRDVRNQSLFSASNESKSVKSWIQRLRLGNRPTPRRARNENGFVSRMSESAQRRAKAERLYGRPLGKLRGYDRYLLREGEISTEVLVHDTLVVPMEVNVAKNGQLQSHKRLVYQSDASGALRLYSTHLERLQPQSGGKRVVTDMQISNYRAATAGGIR